MLPSRFWSKVNKDGPVVRHDLGRCWIWTASSTRDGYGRFKLDGTEILAHVVSLIEAVGNDPDLDQACHRCDQPSCVNPNHLFWGTNSTNQIDCAAKGRHHLQKARPVGTNNANAKLTEKDVKSIRLRLGAGESRTSVANDIGVSYHTIRLIQIGKLWREVS
jgi:hypothetical protein